PRQRPRGAGRRAPARRDRELHLLLARPGTGGHGIVRASARSSVCSPERGHGPAGLRMRSWLTLAVIAALLAALPLVGNNYALRLATTVCMYAVLAQSWNFIGGLAGYPSFATAAFFGVGAYTSAILQNHGAPIALAWGSSGLVAMAFAALIGGGILHLRGHYFA